MYLSKSKQSWSAKKSRRKQRLKIPYAKGMCALPKLRGFDAWTTRDVCSLALIQDFVAVSQFHRSPKLDFRCSWCAGKAPAIPVSLHEAPCPSWEGHGEILRAGLVCWHSAICPSSLRPLRRRLANDMQGRRGGFCICLRVALSFKTYATWHDVAVHLAAWEGFVSLFFDGWLFDRDVVWHAGRRNQGFLTYEQMAFSLAEFELFERAGCQIRAYIMRRSTAPSSSCSCSRFVDVAAAVVRNCAE